jgi:hypothetical protein
MREWQGFLRNMTMGQLRVARRPFVFVFIVLLRLGFIACVMSDAIPTQAARSPLNRPISLHRSTPHIRL